MMTNVIKSRGKGKVDLATQCSWSTILISISKTIVVVFGSLELNPQDSVLKPERASRADTVFKKSRSMQVCSVYACQSSICRLLHPGNCYCRDLP